MGIGGPCDGGRRKLGDAVVMDKADFEQALAIQKRLSGMINATRPRRSR